MSKLSAKGWKNLVARDKDKIKEHRSQIHVVCTENLNPDVMVMKAAKNGA